MLPPSNRRPAWPVILGVWLGLLALTTHPARTTFNADPEYLIDTWETEDGLPENSATALAQAQDGYLWFGTFNGLVRFDGVRFHVLDRQNTPQLPAADAINLHLDRRGRLWVSTSRGLVVHDGSQWRPMSLGKGGPANYVRSFAERADGTLLLTTFDGRIFEFTGAEMAEMPSPPGRAGDGYLGFADEQGRWWVVQQWFVGSWNGRGWEPAAAVTNLFAGINGGGPARDGGLWLLAGTNLVKHREGTQPVRLPLPEWPGNVWSLTEDSRGNIWIATFDRGLCRVSPAGGMRRWTTTNGLSYDGTRCVREDREGNLWVGTSGGGLQRFKPRRFRSYGTGRDPTQRNVTSIWPDAADGMWIATYAEGVFRWRDDAVQSVALPPEANTLNVVNSVLTDRAGRTWFGTWGQSVCVTDSLGFHRIPHPEVGGHNIHALFEDSRGRIWVGGAEQVSVGGKDAFRPVPLPQGARLAGVRCFAEDSAGAIWASNLEALYRYQDDQFVEVRDGEEPLRDITCLKADADGTLWLGLERGGLLCRRGGRTSHLELGPGPASPGVRGILEDGRGFFWMASNRGVLRASRADLVAAVDGRSNRLACPVLDQNDGLPSIECPSGRQPTCARDRHGRLWFATLRGAAMIDPAGFRLNAHPPPVVIESVAYQEPAREGTDPGRAGIHLDGPFPDRLLLPAGTRRLEIHYTAPSLAASGKVRFQFELEGLDSGWRDAGDQRLAQFYELAPGTYRFRVRAANDDGVWNETGASLAFSVLPFFWQTGWFRVGIGTLVVGAGAAAARWRHRRARAEMERTRRHQAELAHVSRVSILGELSASMAHELNQPLTAILTNAQAAQRFLASGREDLTEFREILKDIAYDTTRARDVIRHLRALVKKSEPAFTTLDLGETIHEVVGFLHGDIVARNVQVALDLEPDLPPVQGDRTQLQQVIINLLINAFDALGDTPVTRRLVRVTTTLEAPSLVRVTVQDNGPGIPAGKLEAIFEPFYTTKREGMGMGLSVTRSIVEAHGGRIHAENPAPGGAALHFTLPAAPPS